MVDVRTARLLDIVHHRTATAVSTWLDGVAGRLREGMAGRRRHGHDRPAPGLRQRCGDSPRARHAGGGPLPCDQARQHQGRRRPPEPRRRSPRPRPGSAGDLGHRVPGEGPTRGTGYGKCCSPAPNRSPSQSAHLKAAWDLGDPGEVYNAWAADRSSPPIGVPHGRVLVGQPRRRPRQARRLLRLSQGLRSPSADDWPAFRSAAGRTRSSPTTPAAGSATRRARQ